MLSVLSGLESLALSSLQQSLAVRVLITAVILVAGLFLARLAARLTRRIWESRLAKKEGIDRIKSRKSAPDTVVQYIVILVTLIVALIPINAAVTTQLGDLIGQYTQRGITAVLVFLLGVILVHGIVRLVSSAINNLEVRGQIDDMGISPRMADGFLVAIKLLLYVLVMEVAITQLGVSTQILNATVTAASYGFIALIVALGFFGFKDLIQNYAAGIYLRGSDIMQPGKKVRVDEAAGEIRDVAMFSTTISTDSGYFMLTPNKRLMDTDILFKRVKADIETLEHIKDYFIVDDEGDVATASAEMALAMFGFEVDQSTLAETAETANGITDANHLIASVEEHTDGDVRASFVDYDEITDLANELKTWFNEGALVIPRFSKPVLFPQSEEATYYALSVGVEGDELLLVDPGATRRSGVYYVEAREMMSAIAEGDGARGYIVLAPKGTTGYWRIKEGLIYADRGSYEELSKTLETRLRKLLREGRILKEAMPAAVQDYLDEWRRGEHVTRVWDASTGGTHDETTESH